MSLKPDLKSALENAFAQNMYGFEIQGGLMESAFRAVSRIYALGLSIRDGHISPGTNNVSAAFAALAFDDEILSLLAHEGHFYNDIGHTLGEIIRLAKDVTQDISSAEETAKRQEIYDLVQELKSKGWEPGLGEPNIFVNGSRVPTPREPKI